MKPRNFSSLIPAIVLTTSAVLSITDRMHADQTWTGDAANGAWGTVGNWSGSAIPLAGDTVVFDSTSDQNIAAIALGANRVAKGITLTNPPNDVTITAGSALTLASGGINLAAASRNFTSAAGVTISSAIHPWIVAAGFTAITPVPVRNGGANNDNIGGHIVVSGAGAVKMGAGLLAVIADNGPNPYVTIGTENWAGTDATGTVIPVTYTTDAFTGNASIITPNTYAINGASPTSVRFANTSGPVIVNNSNTSSLRGILMTSGADSVTINGGSIRPNRSSTAGCSFSIIQNNTSKDLTIGSSLAIGSSNTPSSYIKGGPGRLISTGGYFGGAGRLFINEGIWQFGDGNTTGDPGNTASSIINNASLVFNRSNFLTVITNISGTGSLSQIGSGELSFTTSLSTFTGPVNINAGILSATTLANLGSGTAININGGTFKFLGTYDPTVRTVTIGSSGAAFDTNGNNISFANAFNAGSTGALTKSGAGSLTLTVDNSYSGGTTVLGGKLVANAPNSSTGSGPVFVNSGASVGGAGKIASSVTIASGGKVTPGASVGTLTVGSLDLQSGSILDVEFSASNDLISVTATNGLTLNGGSVTLLQENTVNAFSATGTYTLMTYSGTVGGAGASSLSVANPQPGFTYAFNAAGGSVTLTIGTSGVVRNWITNGGGSWGDNGNWNGTFPNIQGATANFLTNLTSGPATVALNGSKTVGAITFLSTANGYTIAEGSGGSLILNNGALGASILDGAGSHTISAPVSLVSNTVIDTALVADSITLSGIVSGGGTLTKTGAGALSLLGANGFTGDVTLLGGATTFAANGLGTGDLNISGASLVWNPSNTQDISNRTIAFGADPVTFNTNGNDVLLANSIGDGGDATFTKAGAGTLTLASDTTFTGPTTIAGGTLQLGVGGNTGFVTGPITNNATLAVNRENDAVFNSLIQGTGSFLHTGTARLILNSSNTFTGPTSISSATATLVLSNATALQNSTLNYSASGGSLSFGTLVNATLGALAGDKNLALEESTPIGVALTVGGNGATTLYSGVLSGPGSLTKTGAGVMTLSGANSYTGTTTVNGGAGTGVLELTSGGAINGAALTIGGNSRLRILDGAFSASAASNVSNAGTATATLEVAGGTADFPAGLSAVGNANIPYLITVPGGILTTSSLTLGRSSQSITAEPILPANVSVNDGLYINGGAVNVAGALLMGNGGGTNSSVGVRIDSGSLAVGGPLTIGLSNGGRWSTVYVNGGNLTSTDAVAGIQLGGAAAGNAALVINSGAVAAERIVFGQGLLTGTHVLRLTSGDLYLGSGGLIDGGTADASFVRLYGGTLAATTNWSTTLAVDTANAFTIQAADSAEVAFDITLNGALTGTGSLTKTGAGTVVLGGGHAYTGNTTVLDGVLRVKTRTFEDAATVGIASDPLVAGPEGTLYLDFTGGDKVASLMINGETKASGTWGASGSGATNIDDDAFDGPGVLYVGIDVPVSGYESWAALPANGLTAGVNDGPTQDPENDGIENVLEFVLGGHPMMSSTDVLPDLVVDPANFVFTFNRNDDSKAQVTLAFEWGSTLTGWNDVPIGNTSAPANGNGVIVGVNEGIPATNPDVITVTVPRTNAVGGKLFGRIQAVK